MRVLTGCISLVLLVAGSVAGAAEYYAGGPPPNATDHCADVAEVQVRAGWWIDSIQLICRDQGFDEALPRRGGGGGDHYRFVLQDDERITGFSGRADGPHGHYIYTLRVHTDRRTSPEYGGGGDSKGSHPFEVRVPEGRVFVAMRTFAGDFLETVGVLTEAQRRPAESGYSIGQSMRKGSEPSAAPKRCCGTVLGLCVPGRDCRCC